MIETFLGNNNGLSVEVVASDRIEYENKIVYTFNNILGEAVSITIYFNEILYEEPVTEDETTTTTTTSSSELTTEPETTTTTEPETTTTTEPETTTTVDTTAGASTTEPLSYSPLGEELNDEEIVYSLAGVIVYSDVEYQFDGVKIMEDDEEIFRLRSYVDSLNYVRVSYKIDTLDGDQKFFYEIVVDGVVTESAKTKVSLEDGEIKVKLEYVQGLAFGQYDFKIEVVENITTIKIRYSVQNAEGAMEQGNIHIVGTYDALTDTTTYEYTILPDGKPEAHFEGDRGHKGDEDKGHHGNQNGESEDDESENEDEIETEDELEEDDEPGVGEQDRDRDHQDNDDDDYRHHGGDRGDHDEDDDSEDDESEDDESEDDEDDGEVSAEEEIL